jgi:hypothetical protein
MEIGLLGSGETPQFVAGSMEPLRHPFVKLRRSFISPAGLL